VSQRGFGTITLYAAIGAAVVIFGLSVALRVQTHRLEAVSQEYERFKGVTEALGNIYKAKAATTKAAYEANTKRTNDAHKKSTATLNADIDGLRKQLNSGSGGVSSVPVNPQRPELACFDRQELDTAIRRYQSGILEIAGKGAQATLDLDSAKEWAKAQSSVR
jgi:hypothetical protein